MGSQGMSQGVEVFQESLKICEIPSLHARVVKCAIDFSIPKCRQSKTSHTK